MDSLVIDFCELSGKDIEVVGGKGAQLAEMLKKGFLVPPGFCIATQAYKEIVASQNKSIKELLPDANADFGTLQKCGAKIRQHILAIEIPETLEQAIISAHTKLQNGNKINFAVRSSATMEDSHDFSFAGQHDTYLGVNDKELLLHIKKSWASLWTDRAIAYRNKNNLDHFDISLAVVVQKMVPSHVSGVMFTVNPFTGRKETIVNASWGLGESIVSGKVSPDEYLVNSGDFAIKDITVAEKKIMIEQNGMGVIEKSIPQEKQKQQCLSNKQIKVLAAIGQKIEEHYLAPQDIEWALAENKIFILQSRPITTLNKVSKNFPTQWGNKAVEDLLKDKVVYWSNWNVRETMPYPLTHFSWSTFNDRIFPYLFGVSFGTKKDSKLYTCNNLVDLVYGRVYWNMNVLYGHPIIGPGINMGMEQVDVQASRIFRKLHREKKLKPAKLSWSLATLFFTFYNSAKAGIGLLFTPWLWNEKAIAEKSDIYWKKSCEFANLNLEQKSEIELLQAVDDFFKYTGEYWAPSFLALGYASFSYKMIALLTKKWLDISPTKLVAGLQGNKTTEAALELYKLSIVPESVQQVFLDNALEDILPSLRKSEEGKQFHKRLKVFLEHYGHRGAKEFDIAQTRWEDDPAFVLQMIKNYLQLNQNDTTPLEHFNKMAQEREELTVTIRNRFSKVLPFKKWLFNWFLKYAQIYVPFRENPKYYVLKCFSGAKRIVVEVGHRLCQQGHLQTANDIFFLTIPEMHQVVNGTFASIENLASIIAERKKQWQENLAIEPPFIVRSDGKSVTVDSEQQDANVLQGTPVSSGKIEGIARIILDPQDGCSFNKGEILIAPFTDPGWTPLFLTAKAFVMEVGGIISHGAIVAREYGIPAVVGVKNATERIKTGDRIIVDGDKGEVLLVEKETDER